MVDYSGVIETLGLRVPFAPAIVTPRIERTLRSNRYEGGEIALAAATVQAGDRVLELGGGLGLVSAKAGLVAGVGRVVTVEANPDLIPFIAETHRLNGVTGVERVNGIATVEDGGTAAFYLRTDFWASSMEPDSRPFLRAVSVPRLGIGRLIAEVQPTVIVCDIEGAEAGLFDAADLSGVRAIIMELHPKVYGHDGQAAILAVLAGKGLVPAAGTRVESSVRLLERPPARRSELPVRDFHAWPIRDPRVAIVTCMKDEGPFILEWIAWHKAAGVTDIVVFSNDCTDGTDRLLDRLADMGEVVHLPNPALATRSTAFQPAALAYAHHLRTLREADFFISMDVDEFINVRLGEGRLGDLFAAVGDFDVLSMTELNHGANGHEEYRDGWLKDLFPLHETETPGKLRARRGVKSIVRLSPRVERLRNHRPDMLPADGTLRWIDGSGRPTEWFLSDQGENGHDSRGTYGLVTLDHFALRSLDSYLVKMFRGDVVKEGRRVSQKYWRTRNRNEAQTADFGRLDAAARAYHRTRLAVDADLMALHDGCVAAHVRRIEALRAEPDFAERRAWALREAW